MILATEFRDSGMEDVGVGGGMEARAAYGEVCEGVAHAGLCECQ